MAGESLKMDEVQCSHIDSPCRSTSLLEAESDKENRTPTTEMKTVAKLGSTYLSPFGKNGSGKSKGFKIMSDDEVALVRSSKTKNKTSKRRSLATLQPTSDDKGTLTGNGRDSLSIKEAFKRKKELKNVVVNLDVPSIPTESVVQIEEKLKDIDPDSELVKDALALMKSTEKIDDGYWKTIAEERRIALEETLGENEKLYDDVERLEKENETLKKELSELQCYKLLYRNLLASAHCSEDNNEETEKV